MKLKIKKVLSNQYSVLVISCVIVLSLGLLITPKTKTEPTKDMTSEIEQREKELSEKKPELIIENQEGMMTKTHIISRGTVKNIGDLACKFVTLKVEYLDDNDNVLGTVSQYIVGKEGIKPNGSQDFEVDTKLTPSLRNAVDFKYIIMADYTVIN